MEIEIFKNPQFGEIRVTLNENGEPLFCGGDVAKALGYSRPADVISSRCKGVVILPTPTNGGLQQVKYITEADIYRLIMRSNLPYAEQFQDWVCEDVLPAIRKNGIYATPATAEQILNNPDLMIALLQKFKESKENEAKLLKEVEEAKEEVKFCDRIITHLTEKIDVNDMRQTINDILRRAGNGQRFGEAWRFLYREFQKKYHFNIAVRKNYSPYSNLLDYIDKELHMVPELYELACALFAPEYEEVKKRWERGAKAGNLHSTR